MSRPVMFYMLENLPGDLWQYVLLHFPEGRAAKSYAFRVRTAKQCAMLSHHDRNCRHSFSR